MFLLVDDCLQCKSKEEKIVHCNCSSELLEATCRDACQFKCSNPESFDPADGCKNGCIPGWFGQYCNLSCPGMCSECDKATGRCATCLLHWLGPYCNETCPPGLYGDQCNKVCHIYCNRCLNQSYCIECKKGRYGEMCQNLCHQDCVTCNDEPHKCTSCIRGKFLENGSVCLNCPENCVSCAGRDNCTECQSGKYGPTCQMSCPSNCVTCTSSSQCHECVPHRHGNLYQCNSKCRNIKRISPNNISQQCETGEVCQKGCPPLKMGIYCNHSCSQNRYTCDQLTGACFSCVSGFYGPTCNKTCGHCKPGSKGEIQCNKYTGKCADCLSGWYGWRCDEACSIACRTIFCDKFTGTCEPCVTGFYGPRCTEECNSNCYNVTMYGCDKLSGACELCSDGYFGLSCNETCLEYCGEFPCRQQTGVCKKCPSGFYGDKCQKICNQRCSSSNTTKDICDREWILHPGM
ncbi:hypothetical protein ACJMK2_013836 [Sinanodonta woodiana]|uniref:EGF-like domain-containing protein n=1 Tax=Sinanodonta woodiana TaxID=1069815 RepID=A0ABD3V207_SINWO